MVKREIKFKGYNKEIGWVYGNLLEDDRPQEGSIYQIVNKTTDSRFDVEEESVGQCTDFIDRNGVKIYEGDIIQELFDAGIKDLEFVRFDEEEGTWKTYELNRKTSIPDKGCALYDTLNFYCEVVGNIYEEKLLFYGWGQEV